MSNYYEFEYPSPTTMSHPPPLPILLPHPLLSPPPRRPSSNSTSPPVLRSRPSSQPITPEPEARSLDVPDVFVGSEEGGMEEPGSAVGGGFVWVGVGEEVGMGSLRSPFELEAPTPKKQPPKPQPPKQPTPARTRVAPKAMSLSQKLQQACKTPTNPEEFREGVSLGASIAADEEGMLSISAESRQPVTLDRITSHFAQRKPRTRRDSAISKSKPVGSGTEDSAMEVDGPESEGAGCSSSSGRHMSKTSKLNLVEPELESVTEKGVADPVTGSQEKDQELVILEGQAEQVKEKEAQQSALTRKLERKRKGDLAYHQLMGGVLSPEEQFELDTLREKQHREDMLEEKRLQADKGAAETGRTPLKRKHTNTPAEDAAAPTPKADASSSTPTLRRAQTRRDTPTSHTASVPSDEGGTILIQHKPRKRSKASQASQPSPTTKPSRGINKSRQATKINSPGPTPSSSKATAASASGAPKAKLIKNVFEGPATKTRKRKTAG